MNTFDDQQRVVRLLIIRPGGAVDFQYSTRFGLADKATGDILGEEELFAAIATGYAAGGNEVVRLCNEDECEDLSDIVGYFQGDGAGGIERRADLPAGVADPMERVHYWDAAAMERRFLTAEDGRGREVINRVVRFERTQWGEDLERADLIIDGGTNKVIPRPVDPPEA